MAQTEQAPSPATDPSVSAPSSASPEASSVDETAVSTPVTPVPPIKGTREEEEVRKRIRFVLDRSSIYATFLGQKLLAAQKQAKERDNATEETAKEEPEADREDDDGDEDDDTVVVTTRSGTRATGTASKRKRNTNPGSKKRTITDYLDEDMLKKRKVDEGAVTQTKKPLTKPKISSRQPSLVTGGILREYQLAGVEWMVSLYENGVNGILADEMGLGKTLQTIAFLAYLYEKGVWGPFLVVAPLSTISNWEAEFARFVPDVPCVMYHGIPSERERIRNHRLKKLGPGFPVVITTYEITIRDRKYLQKYDWKYIIVDEGHRLKNMDCKLIRELKTYKSANRMLLTGTPLQNNLEELWSLLHFLMPELFGDLDAFEQFFNFEDINNAEGQERILGQEKNHNVISTLHQILQPFLLRRIKTDVEQSLPKKKEYVIYCPLTPSQKEWYDAALGRDIRNFLIERKTGLHDNKIKEEVEEEAAEEEEEEELTVEDLAELQTEEEQKKEATKPIAKRKQSRGAKVSYGNDTNDKDLDKQSDDVFLERLAEGKHLASKEDFKTKSAREVDLRKATKAVVNMHLMNVVMQLRKVCNHPFLFDWPIDKSTLLPVISEELLNASGKMLVLNRLLDALFDRGHKVLIFSQFTTMLDIIQDWAEEYKKWTCCRIDGSVPQEERRRQIQEFNTNPSLRLFLLSTRSGGLGINLTSADTVIIFDSDWNPQMDLQAQDRVHRIGQQKPVMIYRLVTANTVEGRIIEKANQKRKLEKLVIHKGTFKSGPMAANSAPKKASLTELAEMLAQEDGEKYQVASKDDVVISDKHLDFLLNRTEAAYNGTLKLEDDDALFAEVFAGSSRTAHQPNSGNIPVRSADVHSTFTKTTDADIAAPVGSETASASISTAEGTSFSVTNDTVSISSAEKEDGSARPTPSETASAFLPENQQQADEENTTRKSGSDGKCQHVKGTVKLPKLRKALGHVKDWDHCQGCLSAMDSTKLSKKSSSSSGKRLVSSLEAMGLDEAKPKKRAVEAMSPEHLWMCLTCCEINCGRAIHEHALQHHDGKKADHPLAINLGTMDCWCYDCDKQIVPSKNKNQVIQECQTTVEKVLQIKQSKARAASGVAAAIALSKKSKESVSLGASGAVAVALPKIKIMTPGLQNLGNTCFFNSVVQVLTETKSLKAILSEDETAYSVFPTSLAARTDAGLGPLTLNFKEFLQMMWKQQGGKVSPRELFSQIARKWKVFRGMRQQDSQELMRYLFDGIKQEEMDLFKRQLAEEKETLAEEEVQSEQENDDNQVESKDVAVTRTEISPKYCSYAPEEFYDLSLPVRGPSAVASGSRSRLVAQKASPLAEEGTDATYPIPASATPSKAHMKHVEKLLRPIGLSNSENLSIERSLNQFTGVDCLDGENKFACENCYKLTVPEGEEDSKEKEKEGENDPAEEAVDKDNTVPEMPSAEAEPPQSDISAAVEKEELQKSKSKEAKNKDDSEEQHEGSQNGASASSDSDSDSDSILDSASDSEEAELTDRFGNTLPRPVKLTNGKSKGKMSALASDATAAKAVEKAKIIFRKAYKRYLISSLPPTLVFHLKRFEQSGRFGQMRKIEDHVEIPVELDMSPYFVPKSDLEEDQDGGEKNVEEQKTVESDQATTESKRYRLYGAVVHMGTLGGGHYTNYVLSSKVELLDSAKPTVVKGDEDNQIKEQDGEGDDTIKKLNKEDEKDCRQWIACSDTSVRQASLKEVLSSRAYLLFYERIDHGQK
ncbi:hypothetical protein BGZ83_009717 [Gryganskiella cystojenkinii]|nr:hypothetical protein BGZ83_009717 [Gryganskiella cystojenkinii]